MKITFKIIGISLLSIVGLILIALAIAFWFVLTPGRVTPFVQQTAQQYLTCNFEMSKTDVVFFKTFPSVGIEVDDVLLRNDDTIASVASIDLSVNWWKLLFRNEVVVNRFTVNNARFNVLFDADGNSNLDIIALTDTLSADTASADFSLPFDRINLKSLALKNCSAVYSDLSTGMLVTADGIDMLLKGKVEDTCTVADIALSTKSTFVKVNDSTSLSLNSMKADVSAVGYGAFDNLLESSADADCSVQLGIDEFILDGETLAKADNMTVNLPARINLSDFKTTLDNALIRLGKESVNMSGTLTPNDEGIDVSMDFVTNWLDVENVLSYMPQWVIDELDGMLVYGEATLDGTLKGMIADSALPVMDAKVACRGARVVYDEYLPAPIIDIEGTGNLTIDLYTEAGLLVVDRATGSLGGIDIVASGSIDDLLYDMNMDITAEVSADDINKVKAFLPDDMNFVADGSMKANLKGQFNYDQIYYFDITQMKVDGTVALNNLNFVMDTIAVTSPQLNVGFSLPSKKKSRTFNGLLDAQIGGRNVHADITNYMNVEATNFNLKVSAADFMDDFAKASVMADFGFGSIEGNLDTIGLLINNAKGSASMTPNADGTLHLGLTYHSNDIDFNMGNSLTFNTNKLGISTTLNYSEDGNDIFEQLDPTLTLVVDNGKFEYSVLPLIEIPTIKFDMKRDSIHLYDSKVQLGYSDLGLEGEIYNLSKYLKHEDLLLGNLNFVSDYTDIDQIVELTNGLGASDSTEVQTVEEESEDNPFIVPLGVDVALTTLIKRATYGDAELHDIGGKVTVNDGVLVLEQMGFTTSAARMQLTAMYKTSRRNHLFAGVDLHLLDIDVHELINMIPTIDTVVPMLKNFDGHAQFHFAIETYLKSNYEPKLSTLRGAMAIEGKNLALKNSGELPVILDKLKVTHKGDLMVDSLSCEMTVFRNEIDVYPFLISLQDYQAVVSGRHNLDMTFDYHIDVVDTPPLLSIARLGLDVKGSLSDLKYSVTPSRYANLYKPEKRTELQSQTLNFKKMIADSLKRNVKE